jgi:hypothetical protein
MRQAGEMLQSGLETNIFPILNLAQLSSRYRLYQIRGLDREHESFFFNDALLKRKLSYSLQNPVTTVEHKGNWCLVVRAEEGDRKPPAAVPLVCSEVRLDPLTDVLELDYTLRDPENDEICLRFLQFLIQEPLLRRAGLWQTSAGQPFYEREPQWGNRDIVQYRGFKIRPALTPEGGMGLAVDTTTRFVARHPLRDHWTRDQFVPLKGSSFIYHYGYQWYQIKAGNLSDLNVAEHKVPEHRNGGKLVPLLEFIHQESEKPLPPEVANLAHDASVILYRNNRNEERAAPTSLCYRLYDTHDNEVASLQRKAILNPFPRRMTVRNFVFEHLQSLRFGTTRLQVAGDPILTDRKIFRVPDLEFGNGQVLSERGTPGARHVSLDRLGAERKAMLRDAKAGFYSRDPLGRQHLLLPQSVADSWGSRFLCDLKAEVNTLFPQQMDYAPQVLTYDDRGPRNYAHQGRAIKRALEANSLREGYAVVMIHPTTDQQQRQEDQLEAMAIRQLRDCGVMAAVIHTSVGSECYEIREDDQGNRCYRPSRDGRKAGKLRGYLAGVALNSVLLTNERWPFVLNTRLHADITIGVDVKHNTAGLIVVGSNGADVRPFIQTSRHKEKLETGRFKSYLMEIVGQEAAARKPGDEIRTIVIHRDGRLFDSEWKGAHQAFEQLKKTGIIASDATLTIVEIQKSSPVPLRLFDRSDREGGLPWVENPQIGCYYLATENEGYLCATGRAFHHPGTVNPLHVRRRCGSLSLEECLEDIYFLTALTWTRPEDCARYPISIKLNDRYLGEEATPYDADIIEFDDEDEVKED